MSLKPNSIFFITGAANGIGRKTAELVVRKGHKVIIADIEGDAARATAKALGENAVHMTLDVRDSGDWAETLNVARTQHERIDVIINNAGVMNTGFLLDQTDEEIRQMMDVNLWGLTCGLRAGAKFFKEQGNGHLITIGSMASFVSLKGQAFYSATKHAARSIHYGFAMEMEDTPIKFSIIHPGSVETRMLEKQVGEPAAVLSFAEPTLQPERIAAAVYRAADTGAAEIIIPPLKGFFSRIVGVFPGFLSSALRGQWERGRKKMNTRM
jgi:NADP-dependent 3-hydroxy acid dehydrogenase YdfG